MLKEGLCMLFNIKPARCRALERVHGDCWHPFLKRGMESDFDLPLMDDEHPRHMNFADAVSRPRICGNNTDNDPQPTAIGIDSC